MDIDIGRVTRPKEAHRYGYNVEYCSFAEVVSALAPVSTDQISAIVYARTTSEQREKWIDAFKEEKKAAKKQTGPKQKDASSSVRMSFPKAKRGLMAEFREAIATARDDWAIFLRDQKLRDVHIIFTGGNRRTNEKHYTQVNQTLWKNGGNTYHMFPHNEKTGTMSMMLVLRQAALDDHLPAEKQVEYNCRIEDNTAPAAADFEEKKAAVAKLKASPECMFWVCDKDGNSQAVPTPKAKSEERMAKVMEDLAEWDGDDPEHSEQSVQQHIAPFRTYGVQLDGASRVKWKRDPPPFSHDVPAVDTAANIDWDGDVRESELRTAQIQQWRDPDRDMSLAVYIERADKGKAKQVDDKSQPELRAPQKPQAQQDAWMHPKQQVQQEPQEVTKLRSLLRKTGVAGPRKSVTLQLPNGRRHSTLSPQTPPTPPGWVESGASNADQKSRPADDQPGQAD